MKFITGTLFKEARSSLGGLIDDIILSLPKIQQLVVRANVEVDGLFHPMYRDQSVGYFLSWQTCADGAETKVVGDTNKQKTPA